jgi:predicted ester cyclase
VSRTVVVAIFTALCCLLLVAQDRSQTPSAGAAAPDKQAPASTAVSSETPDALARKYVEVWNTGDMAVINSFPRFIMHNHGGRVAAGPEMLGRVVGAWRKSMPDLLFTIDDTVTEGDKVAMRLTIKGTYKERLFPDTADPASPPRPIRVTAMMMFRVKNGKIEEIWQEIDESMMKSAMGGPRQMKNGAETGDAGAGARSAPAYESASGKTPPKP